MLPNGRRLGAHLPVKAGLVQAADRAGEIGASAMQIFGDNPTAWRRKEGHSPQLPDFRRRVDELDIAPIAIHASYLINLAGPDPGFFTRSVEILAHELRVAPAYGARFVNVHTGSHKEAGLPYGVERVADGVKRVLDDVEAGADAALLVLENSAGGGAAIGTTIEELEAIAEAVEARGVPRRRLAFCVDTAHAWAAGYRFSEPDETDAFLAEWERRIGLERLVMMHLNDSKSDLGSRLDRHEHVGAGRIGERGMAHILRHPLLAHVATYVETPGMDEGYDAINVRRAHDLTAGRPLEPLPPGAFALRGSRSRGAPEPAAEPV
jgi:deoxyribonuclease IV